MRWRSHSGLSDPGSPALSRIWSATYFWDYATDQENPIKAIIYHEYGSPDVLELQDIEKPGVEDDDVLVRVHAASVNPYDWHWITGLRHSVRHNARSGENGAEGALPTTDTQPYEPWSQRRRATASLLVVALLVIGGLGRHFAVEGTDSALLRWLPWFSRETVTLFFGDEGGDYLVPVSRTVSRGQATPEQLVDALLAGPDNGTGLINLIPEGTVARSVSIDEGLLAVDLGGSYGSEARPLAHEAVYQSMRLWPGVGEVLVSVEGVPLVTNTSGHLLYYYNEPGDMLVAMPTSWVRPADVLAAWLEGPANPGLIGLPSDVESLGVELATNELLTLRFTFRESVRDFASDHPESVHRVLEGLIATFNTGFPEVGAVLLDFEGRNALGLGQCANLLNTAQLMPEVLNDERLLSRYAVAA